MYLDQSEPSTCRVRRQRRELKGEVAMHGGRSGEGICADFNWRGCMAASIDLDGPCACLYCLCCLCGSQSRLTNQELFGSVDTEAAPTESSTDIPGGPSTMQKYSKYFSRGSALVFIPFTSGFPSGANQNSCQVPLAVRSNCQPWS